MDLRAVSAGALWVLGLGIVLATFSYASWWASFYQAGLRRAWGRPAFTLPLDLGLALVCAGFAVAGREWWEWLLWGALAVLFAAQAGYAGWRIKPRTGAEFIRWLWSRHS